MSLWHPHLSGTLNRLRRYRHIVTVLAKYGFEEVAGGLHAKFASRTGDKEAMPRPEKPATGTRPVRIRQALQELGPTFIKLGQVLSTRPDLVAPEYIEQLEQLQDRVPPETAESIIAQVEDELGDKIDVLFESFDRECIAAGSIAQVHKAVTNDGRVVAVKVRRPGIVDIVKVECEILEEFAGLLKSTVLQHETIDVEEMVNEFAEAIQKETDFASEKRNQLRFLTQYADDPTVHVPALYEEYCTRGVLTMEYIDGIRPGDLERGYEEQFDRKILANRGAEFVLKQVFKFGFFHTDPHPGNFFLLPENVLAPIDFGQVARLSVKDRRLFNEIVLAIVNKDATNIVKRLERDDMLDDKTDRHKLTSDIEQMLDTYHNFRLKDIPFGMVASQTFELFRNNYVVPPTQFTLMLKSLMTIEAFAISLDPEFRIIEALKPHAKEFQLRDFEPRRMARNLRRILLDVHDLAGRIPDDINAIMHKVRQGKFQMRLHHEHLDDLAKTLDKSSNRISFALIIAALLVASSHLVSEEGTVVGLFDLQTLGLTGYVIAAIIGIWLVISIIRSRHF